MQMKGAFWGGGEGGFGERRTASTAVAPGGPAERHLSRDKPLELVSSI